MHYVLTLSVALIAYNAATNLVPFPRWSYVPLNLALAALLIWSSRRRGTSWQALGLDTGAVGSGLRWGLVAAAAVLVAVGVGVLWGDAIAPVRRLLADERATGITGIGLAYETLLRIPFGTALFEEVAFRGVLLAEISRVGSVASGVVVSSVVFGLFHIGPALATIRLNEPGLGLTGQVLGVAGAVAITAIAGVLFCVLRLASGSLLAPLLAHGATNAFGLLGAVVSRR